MKKVILLAAFAVITSLTFGQVSFGIHVGGNVAFSQIKQDDVNGNSKKQDTDPKIGIIGGFVASIPFGTSISFCPGLNFVQKGYKYKHTETVGGITEKSETKATLNYIEVPLNFAYNLPVGESKLFFGLGPVIGVGLSGKYKDEYSLTGFPDDNSTTDIKFDGKKYSELDADDDDGHLKRLNLGADVFAGFKMPMGIFVKVGYQYDFMNIDPNKKESYNPSYKTSGVNLSVGYMFGGSSASKTKTKTTTTN